MVVFENAEGGLLTKDGQPPKEFALAGEDRQWHWAEATIQDNTVLLRSEAVAKPVAVRYGWADNPRINLYNQSHLPAVPFRMDDWERISED